MAKTLTAPRSPRFRFRRRVNCRAKSATELDDKLQAGVDGVRAGQLTTEFVSHHLLTGRKEPDESYLRDLGVLLLLQDLASVIQHLDVGLFGFLR